MATRKLCILFLAASVAIWIAAPGAVRAEAGDPGAANRLVIHADQPGPTINRNVYGQFAEHLGRCIYDGVWVGPDSPIPNTRGIRKDIVEALRKIQVPVIRWPGGCFADEYHWMDGIGPREKRPPMVNTHWGMVTENNSFGTHEFLDLCEQVGAAPYICGNVGSGSVQEMQQWVEYVNLAGTSPLADARRANGRDEPWRVFYWGVGNESWGCGGNMTPQFYADQYRRFSTYIRGFPGSPVYKIACGANSRNYEWTEVLMRDAGNRMNGLSMHYYCGSGAKSRSATRFEEIDWFAQLKRALAMDELVQKHCAVMDQHDPKKRVGLMVDEWGAWHEVEPGTNRGFLYQQNSLRDALVAGLTFNIFHKYTDRVKMTNIAQMVNVLQAMILTSGPQMLLTPTYHVFDMYKVHQDATALPTDLTCGEYAFGDDRIPTMNASASRDKAGKIHVSLCNTNPNAPVKVVCELQGAVAAKVTGQALTADAMTAHNTFDKPDQVKPAPFNDFAAQGNTLTVTLPSKSVVMLEIE
jgi:alpha-N-arabinofuranosidase